MRLPQVQPQRAFSSAISTHDLDLVNIHKRYGSFTVLSDINLSVKAGEFVAIMGPSGCGKTTLLRVIAGLESISSGRVSLQGQDITALPVHKRNTPLIWQKFCAVSSSQCATKYCFWSHYSSPS